MRSGTIYGNGMTGNAGRASYYWSLRSAPKTSFQDAYHLHLNETTVITSSMDVQRWLGRPLRCLVVGKV